MSCENKICRNIQIKQHKYELELCVVYSNAELLARSQFPSGRFYSHRISWGFSMSFLSPKANVQPVPKFHVALYVSHEALPTMTSDFLYNVDLPILNKTFSLIHLFNFNTKIST
jgi:hypothetical protein